MSCVDKTSANDLVDETTKEPLHLFTAKWQQQQQLVKCKDQLQEGHALLAMDVNENNRCCFKDEVQSGYFDQVQVTIHPMMSYYCEGGISTDTSYVSHLVKQFKD